jgi:hypothetical protein
LKNALIPQGWARFLLARRFSNFLVYLRRFAGVFASRPAAIAVAGNAHNVSITASFAVLTHGSVNEFLD